MSIFDCSRTVLSWFEPKPVRQPLSSSTEHHDFPPWRFGGTFKRGDIQLSVKDWKTIVLTIETNRNQTRLKKTIGMVGRIVSQSVPRSGASCHDAQEET